MILIHTVAWLGLAVLAVANGVLREMTYGPRLGDRRAHQLSSVLLIILIGLYTYGLGLIRPPASGGQALAVGTIWLGLTVVFEFGFGRLVRKLTWQKLLADYNLAAGRVWALVLVWVLVAPLVIHLLLA